MIISLILLAAVACIVGFGVALSVRGKRDFAKQNEVVPGRKSPAPASWAGAHSPEAKLHRRLGDAVRAANGNPRLVELGLAAQTKQIEAEAMAIDERLVAAAGLPARHRADAVAEFEPQVEALEDAVAALLTSTTVNDSKQLLEQAVSEADVKLQALAQARAEVEALDRSASGTLPPPMPDVEQGGATGSALP
ncbi:MAG: hypothetical protein ACI9N0_000714 [Ilumatobacter sp.]|jgi:hypothetical protein